MDEWTVTLSRLWQSFLALIGLACKVRLTHAANSARIGREGKSETLVDLLYSQCPSLYGAGAIYRPTLYLAGGHISTIFSSLANFNGIDDVVYDRQYLRTVDGGTLALDIAPRLSECAVDDRPCLLMIHGLTGGSHESYVKSVAVQALRKRGWRIAVLNYRGCGFPSVLTSPQFYHGGYTEDVRRGIRHLRQLLPDAPLLAIGFSLGANILTKLLGEDGLDSPLNAAVALSNPCDFWQGHVALESSALGRLYSRKMAKSLRTVFARYLDIFKDDDRVQIDLVYSNPNQSLYSFDNQVTGKLGGYPNAEAYYAGESSKPWIKKIRVPYLALHAEDDPITAYSCLPQEDFRTNKHTILATTSHGGHLGWYEGFDACFTKRRWISKPSLEFFAAVLSADSQAKDAAIYSDETYATSIVAAETVESKANPESKAATFQGL